MQHQHNDQSNDACVFGVYLDQDYNAADVRDAMLKCFVQANGENIAKAMDIDLPEDQNQRSAKLNKLTESFIRQAFKETSGNYDAPTKQSIIAALDKLKEYAEKQGHSQEMISDHVSQIMKLIDGLKE